MHDQTNSPGDEVIRFTADVVATTPDRRVLLIERAWPPFEGMWALPGGHVEKGETSQEAAVRELAEETGVHVPTRKLTRLGVWDGPGRDPRGRYVTVAYQATVPDGTEAVAGDDARTARWWPLDALPPLAFDHAEIIAATAPPSTRTGGAVEIVSFGYLHQDRETAPAAHLTLDLRVHYRDPHVTPELRQLTGRDAQVVEAVTATPGILDLVQATAAQVQAYRQGPGTGPVTVAVGCAGGRHRSVVVADALGDALAAEATVTVTHLHLDRPVVDRPAHA
ncbi:NUDIX domain-containing protein [Streptomyces hydrogenans]|uniref:NUDIX domain-containing protein n=1 Tax=Streptomyces hydrogenans TaxID=1873719 RepID=UPI00381F0E20